MRSRHRAHTGRGDPSRRGAVTRSSTGSSQHVQWAAPASTPRRRACSASSTRAPGTRTDAGRRRAGAVLTDIAEQGEALARSGKRGLFGFHGPTLAPVADSPWGLVIGLTRDPAVGLLTAGSPIPSSNPRDSWPIFEKVLRHRRGQRERASLLDIERMQALAPLLAQCQ